MNNPASQQSIIEIHLREVSQLFDSLDPSPFHERDLNPSVEKFIVDSAKELPSTTAYALVITPDQPARHPDEGRIVEDAVRTHFARRSRFLQRDLRRLIRRGFISLGSGLAFLVVIFIIAQTIGRMMGDTGFVSLLRESMLIVGWVAMWKPLEIFLYDWWPIVSDRRFYDRLSRVSVRIVYRDSGNN